MKQYSAKRNKGKEKVQSEFFDKTKLTALDLELLADFKKRRETYDHEITRSNIIHTKQTCPGCGFPTFEKDDSFATCIICFWEGMSSDKNDTLRAAPNYISLMEHRINISAFLRSFLEINEIDSSVDNVIKSIDRFLKAAIPVNQENFDQNLKNILPTSLKK